MNKKEVLNKMKERLNIPDEQLPIIGDITEKYSIIGKSNKNKMIKSFMNELNISESVANDYYNTLSSIIMTGIKNKIKHPFGNQKDSD